MDDRTLMGVLADTDFIADTRGRMVWINDPERRPAPRVFLGCTMAGYVVRFGETLPDAIAERLLALVECLPPVEELRIAPDVRGEVRRVLETGGGSVREG